LYWIAPAYHVAPCISASPKEGSQGQCRWGPGLSAGSKQRWRSGLPARSMPAGKLEGNAQLLCVVTLPCRAPSPRIEDGALPNENQHLRRTHPDPPLRPQTPPRVGCQPNLRSRNDDYRSGEQRNRPRGPLHAGYHLVLGTDRRAGSRRRLPEPWAWAFRGTYPDFS